MTISVLYLRQKENQTSPLFAPQPPPPPPLETSVSLLDKGGTYYVQLRLQKYKSVIKNFMIVIQQHKTNPEF